MLFLITLNPTLTTSLTLTHSLLLFLTRPVSNCQKTAWLDLAGLWPEVYVCECSCCHRRPPLSPATTYINGLRSGDAVPLRNRRHWRDRVGRWRWALHSVAPTLHSELNDVRCC